MTRSITVTEEVTEATQPQRITLNLRSQPSIESIQPQRKPRQRHIRWGADVIDNENLNRKKSNACCKYHAKLLKPPELVDEEDEDASDDHLIERCEETN